MGADGDDPRQPPERRRLVRTQIEELFALYRLYPLPEFESVGRPTVTRSRITIRCLQRLSSETRMHEQWRFGGKSKRGQVNVEGSAAWLPSPIPPPRNSGPNPEHRLRSTLKWHPPHPETGPGDAHE